MTLQVAGLLCVFATVALIFISWRMGRRATSDGDYGFLFPLMLAGVFFIAACVLGIVRHFVGG